MIVDDKTFPAGTNCPGCQPPEYTLVWKPKGAEVVAVIATHARLQMMEMIIDSVTKPPLDCAEVDQYLSASKLRLK